MSKHLRELQAKKAGLVKQARDLTDVAAAEDRDLTQEEAAHFDTLRVQIETTSSAMDREMALIAEEARSASVAAALATQLPAASSLILPVGQSVVSVTDNRELDPRRGFVSMGDFFRSVRQAEHARRAGGLVDERLFSGSGRGAVAPPISMPNCARSLAFFLNSRVSARVRADSCGLRGSAGSPENGCFYSLQAIFLSGPALPKCPEVRKGRRWPLYESIGYARTNQAV